MAKLQQYLLSKCGFTINLQRDWDFMIFLICKRKIVITLPFLKQTPKFWCLIISTHSHLPNYTSFQAYFSKIPIFLFSKFLSLGWKKRKKSYLFFATIRQSWYGPILTYLPLTSRVSLQTQPIGSVRVAYENWSQEDYGKYWTIFVGPGSPEILAVKVENWFFANFTI